MSALNLYDTEEAKRARDLSSAVRDHGIVAVFNRVSEIKASGTLEFNAEIEAAFFHIMNNESQMRADDKNFVESLMLIIDSIEDKAKRYEAAKWVWDHSHSGLVKNANSYVMSVLPRLLDHLDSGELDETERLKMALNIGRIAKKLDNNELAEKACLKAISLVEMFSVQSEITCKGLNYILMLRPESSEAHKKAKSTLLETDAGKAYYKLHLSVKEEIFAKDRKEEKAAQQFVQDMSTEIA